MERTTIRLPDALLARARRRAAAEGRTLTSLFEEGLRLVLLADKKPKGKRHNNPPVSKATGGLMPELNWEDLKKLDEIDELDKLRRIDRGK